MVTLSLMIKVHARGVWSVMALRNKYAPNELAMTSAPTCQ